MLRIGKRQLPISLNRHFPKPINMFQHQFSQLARFCHKLFSLNITEVSISSQTCCSWCILTKPKQRFEKSHYWYKDDYNQIIISKQVNLAQINKNNKMEFGNLTTYAQMEKYYQKMRSISRTQLIQSIYKTDGKVSEDKIEKDLTQVFVTLTNNYNFDAKAPVVSSILDMFDIHPRQLDNKSIQQRENYLKRKILDSIQEQLKKLPAGDETVQYSLSRNNPQSNLFDWVGVKSSFQNLRSIFQQILLQKVKLFDEELCRLTQMHQHRQQVKQQLTTTARTQVVRTARSLTSRSRVISNPTLSVRKFQKQIDEKGFTNVLIRDHSQFALKKWTQQQQKQFQVKKKQFKTNFRKNGYETPIIFQFVKKYTKTVKARDNIFQKWQNRQKTGITAEQLKYLCSTSLFLNQTMYKSEKDRLNRNIKSLGKQLISKLQFNIAQKVIESYRQFMKKVADLRAHYYQQLTQKRKNQYNAHKKKTIQQNSLMMRRKQFLKFKKIFQNICNSQKMKVMLNPRIFRWVKLFVQNLKNKYQQNTGNKLHNKTKNSAFSRLFLNASSSTQLMKSKYMHPSARVIKRQDIGTMRQPMKKYLPTQRFYYDKSFQEKIKTLNSIKIKSEKSFIKQISGGPSKKAPDYVEVSLSKKQINLSSVTCLKFIIKIQAKWKAVRQRRIYLNMLEDEKILMQKDLQERIKSLKYIYPLGKKLNIKVIIDRLKRVSMRTLNILKPYSRVAKKQINNYTSFSQANFSLAELKNKQSKNSSRRLAEFGKMVELNQYSKLIKSGFVVTAKQINDSIFKNGASAMWWAVKNSNADLTKTFLQGGGNPNSKNYQGSSCLHQAMQNGDVQIIFLLLDYGADLNCKDNKKRTPLYFATPRMLKLLGLQEGVVSSEESLKDNNSLFFKPVTVDSFYPEHYY